MAPQARGGLIVTVIGFFAGIWLFLAPFLVEYQKVGEDWIDATKNDLWTGGALIAISALTLLSFAALPCATRPALPSRRAPPKRRRARSASAFW